jgi:hypothetical protein
MLTPAEQTAWDAYVAEMAARGAEVDLTELIDVLRCLDAYEYGPRIADELQVGAVEVEDLAKRLTLQTVKIVQTGQVPN